MENIDWVQVSSSNVEEVGYNSNEQDMYVRFKASPTTGVSPIYVYRGVPEYEYNNLVSAGSVGSYLNSNIKPFYTAERV